MGKKTGKHWFLVPRDKRSVCVESRPFDDRYRIGRIAGWCYATPHPSPYFVASQCKNKCLTEASSY